MGTAAKTDFGSVPTKPGRNLPDTADRLQSVGSDFQGTVWNTKRYANMKIYLYLIVGMLTIV